MCVTRTFPIITPVVLVLMLAVVLSPVCAIVDSPEPTNNIDQFRYCLRRKQQPELRECIGRTAISFLQHFDEQENVTLAHGFVSTRDEKVAARSLVNFLDADPVDFRGLLENAGAVFSQRSLEWHMDAVFPGLMFKVGPTANANSVAEFCIDTTIDDRQFGFEEPSTARLLAKQYLVPLLLGFKFNLAVLAPLLFAVIVLLLKKSLFLAKFAIFVSSLFGVGGALGAIGGLGGLGGLAGLGGLGGLGGIGGGVFGGANRPLQHGGGHSLAPGGVGYFPGKTTVFNNYADVDELHHNEPYKRTDRKVNFDMPREYVARSTTATAATATTTPDRFYDYERQLNTQDRSGKLRASNGQLGPSAFGDDDDGRWKVMEMRV